jgi:hypothetical protein
MISPVREKILRLMDRLRELTSDVRFGQLIANLSYLAIWTTAEAVWEDDILPCLCAFTTL